MTDIITSPSQLPSISEMGEAESNFIQINAQRQVQGDNFRQGVVDYSFSLAGNQRASMKKSYVRLRAKITKADGTQPKVADKVAFAENWANNLFSSAYFYAGGVDISSKQNFCAQSSMARTRLSSTYGWFKSMGDIYGYDSNFSRRVAEISSDGNTSLSYTAGAITTDGEGSVSITATTPTADKFAVATFTDIDDVDAINIGSVFALDSDSEVFYKVLPGGNGADEFRVERVDGAIIGADVADGPFVFVETDAFFINDVDDGKNDIEIVFQPGALGIWETESCLPSGQYRLSLYPQNDKDLTAGIESKSPSAEAGDFKITVNDMYLYLHTYRAVEPIVNGSYYLDLNEMSTQVKTLNSAVNNNFNMTIPPSTFGIAVWAQSKKAGTTPILPPSIFNNEDGGLLKLKNVQLTFAGEFYAPKQHPKMLLVN